ncbi:pilus assembly PilX N-terminal domain-containing protein [Massilia violaceinigra]|uniref:Pilus assembly PilX N-terminal domain-containing protein n=1 Tax=Massilia violaceinigra TaxID=2045208 RepID=A0ABY4A490_9BURK|nr:agglutinin biogenesis protein MshP [Massilia violaceinigra]UOD28854.1 pilus assembly PilX N-terminal domain-containing protein [Massilia violaceinigra]
MIATPPLRHVQGVSLVTAIFLLVVLSGLAVAMVTLSTTANTSSMLDVQGTRAYLAARAGTEWGVYQVTRANGACTTAASGVASTSTFALPGDGGLARMTVTVVCLRTVDSATGQARYTVRSTACNSPGAGGCPNPSNSTDYVQRVVHVEFSASSEEP